MNGIMLKLLLKVTVLLSLKFRAWAGGQSAGADRPPKCQVLSGVVWFRKKIPDSNCVPIQRLTDLTVLVLLADLAYLGLQP
jgi:hypothetical protein